MRLSRGRDLDEVQQRLSASSGARRRRRRERRIEFRPKLVDTLVGVARNVEPNKRSQRQRRVEKSFEVI